ncbi:MAG: SDR family NAD(P)-dependent oxidoreductase [Clostridia bacterium]|nr:SDR family NAD(P)-dependent oxidoreductase [Clostridia bacterium]
MRNWLYNQTVILSGASSGIGKELVKRLVCVYGAKVIGIARNEEKLLALKNELGERAASFSYHTFDVTDKTAWQDLRKTLEMENVRPILLINNAGVFPPLNRVAALSDAAFLKTLETNFLSVVHAVEVISPILLGTDKSKPAIVNVCSSAALCTLAGTAAYSASKSALKAYSEALQLEEKGKKYVGIVYPGTTATELFRADQNVQGSAMQKIAMSAEKMAKKIAKRILKRKKRSVIGFDAKLMSFAARLMPKTGPAIICKVMKSSKSKAFTDVFDYHK